MGMVGYFFKYLVKMELMWYLNYLNNQIRLNIYLIYSIIWKVSFKQTNKKILMKILSHWAHVQRTQFHFSAAENTSRTIRDYFYIQLLTAAVIESGIALDCRVGL